MSGSKSSRVWSALSALMASAPGTLAVFAITLVMMNAMGA